MQEVCSPARGLESHGLKAICSGAVDTTIADALDMLGCCDCVTNNLLDCVVSDMYGCYRDTLMGTGSDLGAASCIDNVLGCGGRSSMGKLSCDSSFSAFSEQDLYPGAISVCMLAEDDMEPGPARPAFAAKPEPLSLLQHSMPSLASDSPVTSESMQSEQSGVLAFVPMDQQGVDGWVPRKHSDPESPLSSSVASLSAVSSMASLSTMVHIGGAASPCDPQLLQQQQKHHADLVRAAERLGNLHNSGALPASNFCSAAPLPMCPTPRGAADAMAGPSRVSGAPSAPGVGGEGCEASGSGVRASMRPRRAAAFVPMPLAGRAKKRGSAANNTCKIAPNPNGHACTACGATQTPVWRAGPFGPKTLCNACGVRYMKVAKKK